MENSEIVRRYAPLRPLRLADRSWPDQAIETAPRWLSTDLRDGSQALASPMCPRRKLAMFKLLTSIGYKEIEVGFPVSGQDDFDFVRQLIVGDLIPDDVRISVLVPAREELIRRTVESLVGARRATIHLYNATSQVFRRVVFGIDRAECHNLAVRGATAVLRCAETLLKDCDVGLEYSPELFNETEPDFALEVCEAVMDVWEPGHGRETILNFPATVEKSLPNVFADQIEWLHRNLSRREFICLSVHPHNDRGSAVAAAELAQLAGAQRVEGCLFSNGERTGNACLVTLGLNLLTQGLDPEIDFSDVSRIRRIVEECYQMPVHPRHPYAGDLVFTAFSGSHQDAIKKGFDTLDRAAKATGRKAGDLPWQMPYLPVDPKDIGRTYDAVIRVNSQSGKGGAAYVMSRHHGMNLPRGLQVDFAKVVQQHAEAAGTELTPGQLWQAFADEYLAPGAPPEENGWGCEENRVTPVLHVDYRGGTQAAWPLPGLAVYAEYPSADGATWGVGIGRDFVAASQAARRSAERRLAREPQPA